MNQVALNLRDGLHQTYPSLRVAYYVSAYILLLLFFYLLVQVFDIFPTFFLYLLQLLSVFPNPIMDRIFFLILVHPLPLLHVLVILLILSL